MRRLALLLSLPTLFSVVLAAAPESRDVTLTAADGFALQGTFTVPEGKGKFPVVILAHQFRSDRNGWAPLTEKLQQRGIATLALDLRGHGKSTQKNDKYIAVSDNFDTSAKEVGFDQIPDDLVLAANWVRKQHGVNGRRLALAGSSVGATSVLLAAPRIHPVAILALSPGGDGHALASAAGKAHAALMLFAAADDKSAADTAAALRPIFGAHIRLLEGSDHGFAFLKDHSDVMSVFLAEYLTRHNYMAAPDKKASKTATAEKPAAPVEAVK